MVTKSTSMILAVAIVAVAAVAIVGAAYAYTATTSNDSNTNVSTYVVLDQGEVADVSYSGAYDNAVTFSTVNTAHNVTTFTPVMDTNIDGAGDDDAKLLGILKIYITRSNSTANLTFKVSDNSAAQGTAMTGTFAVGYRTFTGETPSSWVYKNYTVGSDNYYSTVAGLDPVTSKPAASTGYLANTVTAIEVAMLVTGISSNDGSAVTPLSNITFTFTAEDVQA